MVSILMKMVNMGRLAIFYIYPVLDNSSERVSKKKTSV